MHSPSLETVKGPMPSPFSVALRAAHVGTLACCVAACASAPREPPQGRLSSRPVPTEPGPLCDNYLEGWIDGHGVRTCLRGRSTTGGGAGYYDLVDTSREERLPVWQRNGADGYHDYNSGFVFVWRHGSAPDSHRVAVARLPSMTLGQSGSAERFICANDVTTKMDASWKVERVVLRSLTRLPSCDEGVPVEGEMHGRLSERSTLEGTVDGVHVAFDLTGRFGSPEGWQYELLDPSQSGFAHVGLLSLLPRASTFLILPAPAGPHPGAIYCAQATVTPGQVQDSPQAERLGPLQPTHPLPRAFVLRSFLRVGRCPGIPATGESSIGPPLR